MSDSMPVWFWLPAALLLWGYLAVDAMARRHNRRRLIVRTIVIARTKAEGKERFPSAVAIITPRNRDAARGIPADRVVVLRSMDNHPDVLELREQALPSIATGRAEGKPETPAEPTHVAGAPLPTPGASVPTPSSPAIIPLQA